MDQENIEGNLIRMAISPYLSTFNESLKEEKNKISRLYGEAMDEVRIYLYRVLTLCEWILLMKS